MKKKKKEKEKCPKSHIKCTSIELETFLRQRFVVTELISPCPLLKQVIGN